MNRILEWLARWYFITYLKPLVDTYLRAQMAKAAMPRTRYMRDER